MIKTVILINGPKRHGKDHLAKLLGWSLNSESEVVSFASPMKVIMAKTFGITVETLEKYKNDDVKILSQETNGYEQDVTDFRKAIQNFANEGMKPVFGEGVWANIACGSIKDSEKDVILIPDFRFLVEHMHVEHAAQFEKYNLITVYIHNDDIPTEDTHASERELQDNNFQFDFIIDNTGKPDLSKEVDKLVEVIDNLRLS